MTLASGNRPMTALEWALLLALAAIWGGSYFFNEVAVRELPVLTVVLARVSLAAAILLAVLAMRGERMPRTGRAWAALFAMGLMNNAIPFALIVGGQARLASGVASILNASTPLFTVVFAHFLTRDERMTGGKLAGVLVGFAGVAVMIGGGAIRSLGTDLGAEVMCLGAAVSYALAGIFGRRFRAMGISPMATATGQVTAASLLLLPVVLAVDRPWSLPVPSLAAIGAVVGLAAVCTALAYVVYFRILATAGATNLLLVTFLVPVSAILLGTLFLGERLQPKHFAGMALIGLGLAAIDGRPWRRARELLARRGTAP